MTKIPPDYYDRGDFKLIGGIYISESYFLECAKHVIQLIPRRSAFGPFTIDDIRNQAYLWCLSALKDWDQVRCLKNFLCPHVRNRLINFRRDNLVRNDPPCRACHVGKYCGNPRDETTKVCQRYFDWSTRNSSKHCLAQAGVHSDIVMNNYESREQAVDEAAANAELLRICDEKIPLDIRHLYLRFRDGGKLTSAETALVTDAIKGIFADCLGNANGDSGSEEEADE